MTDRRQLEAAVRRIDGELRRAIGPGVKLSGPELLDRVRAYAQTYRRQEPEREAARREADGLLPELLDLYRNGGEDDRQWVRELLHAYPTFRWALGWDVAGRQPSLSPEQASEALALFSMKDGGADYRDQKVWLDAFCAALRRSGLDPPALLRQAAELSSDVPRFPPTPSTRGLLLATAGRSEAAPSA
jgi:hypothetical protein